MTQASDDNTGDDRKSSGGPHPSESREMFAEITALMASVAKALDLTEAETAAALERGEVTLQLDRDANGNTFVMASHGATRARVYRGAIKHEQG